MNYPKKYHITLSVIHKKEHSEINSMYVEQKNQYFMHYNNDAFFRKLDELTTGEQAFVLKLTRLKKAYSPITLTEIVAAFHNLNYKATANMLHRISETGILLHIARGKYVLNPLFCSFETSAKQRQKLIDEYIEQHNKYKAHLQSVKDNIEKEKELKDVKKLAKNVIQDRMSLLKVNPNADPDLRFKWLQELNNALHTLENFNEQQPKNKSNDQH